MKTLISPHNPVTGPRHIGHYLGSMKDLVDIQSKFKTIVVLDDFLACLVYPKERAQIVNRTLFVVQDFYNSGFDFKNCLIVRSSKLPNAYQLLLFLSSIIDKDYCSEIHKYSFCGLLKHYQRNEIGLKFRPSLSEVVFPQIGIPVLTLGLGAEVFQGGEEITGYLTTIEEIRNNYSSINKTRFNKVDYLSSAMPFVKSTDGEYMIQGNSILLCSSPEQIRQKVHSTEKMEILNDWALAFGDKSTAKEFGNFKNTKDLKSFATDYLTEKLAPFRKSDLSNGDIVSYLEKCEMAANQIIEETLSGVRDDFGLL